MYTTRYKSHHDAARKLKELYTLDQPKDAYLRSILNGQAKSRRAIYIHVPFCNKVCSFCPFHRPDRLKRREYHKYLTEEIRRIREYPYMDAPIDAINFGGGTPTSLLPEQMRIILAELRQSFSIRENAEISVESSATELTDEMLGVLLEGGVNRLSIGIQTFQDKARKLLGRRGSGGQAAERVANAIRSGIRNTSIDLIYNYPGQSLEALKEDLSVIKELGVAGLSFYSLMLHEKTPLFQTLSSTEKQEMLDIRQEYRFFSEILDNLGSAGFRPLELTKLVRDDLDRYDYMSIRHTGGSCIAIGHGAGGNLENYFYRNSSEIPLISDELRISSAGRIVCPEYRVIDELINDLQKCRAELSAYSSRLGTDLEAVLSFTLQRLESEGLLERKSGMVTLTASGMFWGNNIIDELVGVLLQRRA